MSASAGASVSGGPIPGMSSQDGVDPLSDEEPEAGAVERDPSGRDGSGSASGPEVLLFDEQGREFRFRRHDLDLLSQRGNEPNQATMDASVPSQARTREVEASVPTAAPVYPFSVRTNHSIRRRSVIRAVSFDGKPRSDWDLKVKYTAERRALRRPAGGKEVGVWRGNAEAEEDGIDRSSRHPTLDDGGPARGEAMTDADAAAKVLSEQPSPPNIETANQFPPVPIREQDTDRVMFRSWGHRSIHKPTAINDDYSWLADVDREGEAGRGAEEGVPFGTQADYQSLFSRVPHELFNPYAAQRERLRLSGRDVGGGGEGVDGGVENRKEEGEREVKGEGEEEGEGNANEEGAKDEGLGLKIIKVKSHINKGVEKRTAQRLARLQEKNERMARREREKRAGEGEGKGA
ncbi:MAG: hypothetical protein LQ347_007055 [Umbilicaria vellea]|nr:MAG: hypothetical protein LQ347_007055 [Umbilicaria vellea]